MSDSDNEEKPAATAAGAGISFNESIRRQVAQVGNLQGVVDRISGSGGLHNLQDQMRRVAPASELLREHARQMAPISETLRDIARVPALTDTLRDIARTPSLADMLPDVARPTAMTDTLQDIAQRAASFTETSRRISDTMSGVGGVLDRSPIPTRVPLTELRMPPKLVEMPPNPAHETNKRLKEVAGQLAGLEELMVSMAETVNTVSLSAASFLVEFKAASAQADQVSKRTMFWAVVAVVSTFFLTAIQIGYSEYQAARDGASEAAEAQAMLERLDRLIDTGCRAEAASDIGAGTGTSPR